ncbi:phage tail tape measure protein [Diplocloster agilis]|uniref:Phage tail tape measure protein n=1 Tax=Diplocloster agilis TaxID=2850323 RepID=A0A949JVA8_9FIRM|nr:phage tail tape measure protein [Diplocloster agilis]MBU9735803.1 phage tail tape measure protein [Diplocloster agilis]
MEGMGNTNIKLDLSSLKKAVNDAEKELGRIETQSKLAQSELSKLEAVSKGVGGMFEEAARNSQLFTTELENAVSKANVYRQRIGDLNKEIQDSQKEQKQLKTALEEMSQKYETAQQKVKTLAHSQAEGTEEYKRAVEAAENYKNSIIHMQDQYDYLSQEIEGAGDAVSKFQTKLNNTEKDIGTIAGKLDETQNNAIVLGQSFEDAGGKMDSFGKKIGETGKLLSSKLTKHIVTAGKDSITFALEAEESFLRVGSMIDGTVVTYDKLKSEVTKSSNETGVSITEFNDALYETLNAGIDSADAIQFTNDMIKLARGGFTDTTKAVEGVALTLNTYGLSADQATTVSDKLIKSHQLGRIAVDDLVTSLGQILPIASSVNVDIDNVSAAMAILTQNGISTADATKNYTLLLEELGKSGSNADTVLRNMSGKGFAQLAEEGKPVTEILQMLNDGAEQSGMSLDDMFGSAEVAQSAFILMKDSGTEYNDILGEIQTSTGETQQAFDDMNATSTIKIQTELNKLKNTGIEVGEKLIPFISQGIEFIGKLADKFNELTPEQQKNIIATTGIVAALGPLLSITGSVTSGLGNMAGGFGSILEAMGKRSVIQESATGLLGVADASMAAGSNTGVLGGTLANLISPTGLAAVAIGGVAVALTAYCLKQQEANSGATKLKKSNEDINDSFSIMLDGINEWQDKVGSATSSMSGFNDQILISSEKQNNLKTQMRDIQEEITTISEQAADDRRELTESEIQRLDELFEKMRDLSAQELSVYSARLDVVVDQANTLKDSNDLTVSQYEDRAARITKAAEEETQNIIDKAYEKYTTQMALNKKEMENNSSYSQEWLQLQNEVASKEYQSEVDAAKKKKGDILQIEAEGYQQRSEGLQQYLSDLSIYYEKVGEENKKYSNEITADHDELNTKVLSGEYTQMEARNEMQKKKYDLEDEWSANMAKLNEKYLANMDDTTLKEAGIWLQWILDSEQSGATLTETQKQTAANLVSALDSLPEEFGTKGQETLEALGISLADNGDILYTSTELSGQKALGGIKASMDAGLPEIQENWDIFGTTSGSNYTQSLGESINNGSELVSSFSKALMVGAQIGMDAVNLPGHAYMQGSSVSANYGEGMSGNTFMVTDAVGNTADEISQLDSSNFDSNGWGRDCIKNMSEGISSGKESFLKSAVNGVADFIKSILHFSKPDIGPLREYEKWMPDMMLGFAKGINDSKHFITDELNVLTDDMAAIMENTNSGKLDYTQFVYSSEADRYIDITNTQKMDLDYKKLAALLAEEFHKAPIKLDTSIIMNDGNVLMDSEIVGRKTAPVVSRIISKKI